MVGQVPGSLLSMWETGTDVLVPGLDRAQLQLLWSFERTGEWKCVLSLSLCFLDTFSKDPFIRIPTGLATLAVPGYLFTTVR